MNNNLTFKFAVKHLCRKFGADVEVHNSVRTGILTYRFTNDEEHDIPFMLARWDFKSPEPKFTVEFSSEDEFSFHAGLFDEEDLNCLLRMANATQEEVDHLFDSTEDVEDE